MKCEQCGRLTFSTDGICIICKLKVIKKFIQTEQDKFDRANEEAIKLVEEIHRGEGRE